MMVISLLFIANISIRQVQEGEGQGGKGEKEHMEKREQRRQMTMEQEKKVPELKQGWEDWLPEPMEQTIQETMVDRQRAAGKEHVMYNVGDDFEEVVKPRR